MIARGRPRAEWEDGIARWKDETALDFGLPAAQAAALDRGRELLVEWARVSQAARVLDWPTGSGYCLRHAVKAAGNETLFVATDICLGMLANTKARFEEIGRSNILYVVCDCREMPFRDAAFAGVTSMGGATEVEDAVLAVAESHRVLQPDGRFAISGELYKEGSPSMRICERLGLAATATRARLRQAMVQSGFLDVGDGVHYEGLDQDVDVPDEDRCPLPAKGDWFSLVVARGRKAERAPGG